MFPTAISVFFKILNKTTHVQDSKDEVCEVEKRYPMDPRRIGQDLIWLAEKYQGLSGYRLMAHTARVKKSKENF